jgi:hypothetical protein
MSGQQRAMIARVSLGLATEYPSVKELGTPTEMPIGSMIRANHSMKDLFESQAF